MADNSRLLIVSFGTTQKDARDAAIGGIERAAEQAFPDSAVQRCFTSSMVIRRIEKAEGIHIDDPAQALERAAAEGCHEIVLQPTHVMAGLEYEKLLRMTQAYRERFASVRIGLPLLSSDEDVRRTVSALRSATKKFDDGQTAVVMVGHGTVHEANRIYTQMQDAFAQSGYAHYYVGTIEAVPSMTDVLTMIGSGDYRRVVLVPLMIVAGDHAIHDIAGDAEDSWKSVLAQKGYEVEVYRHGLGESEQIQQILMDHIRAAK